MNPTGTLTLSAAEVPLSDPLLATVSILGPAPLAVSVPAPLLVETSRPYWQVRPTGAASVEKLPDGRERWTQSYRLEPFTAGDSVPGGIRSVQRRQRQYDGASVVSEKNRCREEFCRWRFRIAATGGAGAPACDTDREIALDLAATDRCMRRNCDRPLPSSEADATVVESSRIVSSPFVSSGIAVARAGVGRSTLAVGA